METNNGIIITTDARQLEDGICIILILGFLIKNIGETENR